MTAGTVSGLLSVNTSAYFEVDDVETARRVLAAVPGVIRVTDETRGLFDADRKPTPFAGELLDLWKKTRAR